MTVVALYSIKGGVGKTTTAVNLAYRSALAGRTTLVWDLDAQGGATFLFRVRPKIRGGSGALVAGTTAPDEAIKATDYEDLDLLPADFTYRHLDLLFDAAGRRTRHLDRLLDPLREEYDDIYLDCPPGMSLLSENVLRAADTVLVPLIPTALSVRTLDQLTSFVADDPRGPRIVGFFSMVDSRRGLHRSTIDTLRQERKDLAETAVPALSLIEQMSLRREPVLAYAPRSAAARCYDALWREVVAG